MTTLKKSNRPGKNFIPFLLSIFSKEPTTILFFITDRCNAKCKMCFAWEFIKNRKSRNPLTLNEINMMSGGIKKTHVLILTGGEPYIRKDLPEIARIFIQNNDVRIVSISTNALNSERIKKSTKEMIAINRSVLFRIHLSLYGVGQDHDDICGIQGGFEKFMTTYEKLAALCLQYNNLQINVNTVFLRYNQDKIIQIADFVDSLQINDHILMYVRGHPRQKDSMSCDVNKYKEALLYMHNLSKKRRKADKVSYRLIRAVQGSSIGYSFNTVKNKKNMLRCSAGRRMITIDSEGMVYPCETLLMQMGNIREHGYSICKTLKSDEAKKTLSHIKKNKCFCPHESVMWNNMVYSPRAYPRIIKKFFFSKIVTLKS